MSRFREARQLLSGGSGVDCSGCPANCCPRVGHKAAYILLYPDEAEFLADDGLSFDDEVQLYEHVEGSLLTLVEYVDECPYLTDELRCGAYEKRPIDCRTFPLNLSPDDDGAADSVLAERCPKVDDVSNGHWTAVQGAADLIWPHLSPAWKRGLKALDAELLEE